MFAKERKYLILQKLNQNNSVTVSELMEDYHVSIETIRRDLENMEKEGVLKRVHGGAISLAQNNEFEDVNKRIFSNKELKEQISQKAFDCINAGDVIALDSGTTTATLAMQLKNNPIPNVTIVTYSSEIFHILKDCPSYNLIVTGGQYLPTEKVFYGPLANKFFQTFHFTKSFLVPSALSIDGGLQDFIFETYENQIYMTCNSNQVFILADSTKFTKTGTIKICDISPTFTIITDNQITPTICEQYHNHQITLVH